MKRHSLFVLGISTLVGAVGALSGCDSSSNSNFAAPVPDESAIVGARISGVVRDSTGKVVPSATIHVFQGGKDSAETKTVVSGQDGAFQADVRPGNVTIFVEKDQVIAKRLDFGFLKDQQVAKLDSLKLSKILSGTLRLPGLIDGSSISARIDGSPLSISIAADGTLTFKSVDGQESRLTLSVAGKDGRRQVFVFRIIGSNGKVTVVPVESHTDTTTLQPPASSQTIAIHPGPGQVDETIVIGNFTGTSNWQNTNFGSRPEEGLGGAYDGNTIGRLLWRWRLPDSLVGRQILSARIVFTPLYWGIRPNGGQDLTIEAYKILRPWKEGAGIGSQGTPASPTNDGATALSLANGIAWDAPLVGTDGVDAEALPVTRSTLPYLSTQAMSFDITSAAKDWAAHPETNQGILFRSVNERDGLYLDYPGFATDDNSDSAKRPYLVLEVAPKSHDPSLHALVLQPGPEGQDDAMIIGTFSGTGSHDGNNQGTVDVEGLGGAWDYNTVGRLLWRIKLPDSLQGKTIVNAQAVFNVNSWLNRPIGGYPLRIEAYRLFRPWKEGTGVLLGVTNSSTVDGATSLEYVFGKTWNRPLVGLDGIDADSIRSAYSVLPYADTGSLAFDFTRLVSSWLSAPSSNQGVLFRSLDELNPVFPNYPGFHMSESTDPSVRPKLVIQYK